MPGWKGRFETRMYNKNSTAGRLNQLFIESNLTREEFAKRCKISTSALTNYLKGRIPETDKVLFICKEFNVSADWLLMLSDVRKPSADIRAVCEYTGLSEMAINKIVRLSEENSQTSEVINRVIEATKFEGLVYRLYIYLMNIDSLDESDYDENHKSVEWNDENVTLGKVEANGYFKQGVKEAIGNLCNELYIQGFEQIKFTKAPKEIRIASGDDIVYLPVKNETE